MHHLNAAETAESRHVAQALAKWWWAWLVMGILWIVASIVILQFRQASVTLVGIIFGILLLAAGIQELVLAAVYGCWRWLWAAFGIIFIAGGLYALIFPVRTFLAIAGAMGFLFTLVGIFWMIEAFATRATNSVWWVGLISGPLMILLGFWASGQFLATQAYALLIFVGLWALAHGIIDIIKAFVIKESGALAAA